MKSCSYTFRGPDGENVVLRGMAAIKAFLASGGLEYLRAPEVSRTTERDVTQTPEFKRWFGDSVMTVDGKPGGKPLTLYHGGFPLVDQPPGKGIPKASTRGALGYGFYMTPDEGRAEMYAGESGGWGRPDGKVTALYARLLNPLVIEHDDKQDPVITGLVAAGMPRDKAIKKVEKANEEHGWTGKELMSAATKASHDGVVLKRGGKISEVVTYQPTQVKSAIGNDGSFSWSPDIRKSAERHWYSQLERAIEGVPARLDNQSAVQWSQWLKANASKLGVKQDEVTWSGIEDWLKLKGKEKVSKAEIGEYLAEGGVRVEETVLGDGDRWTRMDTGESTQNEDVARQWASSGVDFNYDKSSTKYSQYTLPGGTNYREVLLTLPEPKLAEIEPWTVGRMRSSKDKLLDMGFSQLAIDTAIAKATETGGVESALRAMDAKVASGTASQGQREAAQLLRGMASGERKNKEARLVALAKAGYKSGHWDQKNVLAHIRLNDRVDADGKRVLFVEELQSDFAQDARKKGIQSSYKLEDVQLTDGPLPATFYYIKTPDNVFQILKSQHSSEQAAREYIVREKKINSGGVPSAPFIDDTTKWLNLAMKRVIKLAVDDGYDAVAFVNGEQSADRYDLSKQISKVLWNEDTKRLTAYDKNTSERRTSGRAVIDESDVTADRLEDYVGKDVAKKLLEMTPDEDGDRSLSGLDLKVGGEGMKAFYDKIVPQAAGGLVKKMGGEGMTKVTLPKMPGGRAVVRNGVEIKTIGDIQQPGFLVTDEMRDKASGGMPLFSRERQTDTEAFKNWFGDSKVVDAGGKPLVVYHGTAEDFAEFDPTRAGRNYFSSGARRGMFFTSNPGTASVYAEKPSGAYLNPSDPERADFGRGTATIMPVYLSLQNPLVISTKKSPDKFFDGRWEDIFSRVEARGHDGAIIRGGAEFKRDLYVALEPTQIKSAIGNTGAFATDNPDITKSTERAAMGLNESRLDRVMNEWGYTSGKSRAALTYIDPSDFLAATTESPEAIERIRREAGELDMGNLTSESQTPFLKVEKRSNDKEWRIVGHEGRHRMAALQKAGYNQVPIVLYQYGATDDFGAKISGQRLMGQDFEYVGPGSRGQDIVLGEATSITFDNKAKIADEFGRGDAQFSRERTDTPEFKRWFGGSVLTDNDSRPMVMYHQTKSDFSEFKPGGNDATLSGPAIWVRPDPSVMASGHNTGTRRKGQFQPGTREIPLYVRLTNALGSNSSNWREVYGQFKSKGNSPWLMDQAFIDELKSKGYDGVMHLSNDGEMEEVAVFDANQVKSVFNDGSFDETDSNILSSAARNWQTPGASKFDDAVQKFQDKNVDLLRVQQALKEAGVEIANDRDAYLKEELFHGRAAKRTEDFTKKELEPLTKAMADRGLTIEELDEYLHARHAKEANDLVAERNPDSQDLQDGGSGMKSKDAQDYLAGLPSDKREHLAAVAAQVDKMLARTRQLMVDYELEGADTVKGWGEMFQHYVPLMREDDGDAPSGLGMGQGFSIKGREVKSRTGSTKKVVDILANIALQRERVIVRGEKNRVGQALVNLARENENKDFWTVDLTPTTPTYDPKKGVVVQRPDPMFKMRPNVLVAKFKEADGSVKEHAVIFDEKDSRAVRAAASLKNLEAARMEGFLGGAAAVTRYFSAIVTQYNPVFGVINFMRDFQAVMLNLKSTPLDGKQKQIAADSMRAVKQIYSNLRSGKDTGDLQKLFDEFRDAGGQTGFRQLYADSADRADAIREAINPDAWTDTKLGKIFTANGVLKVPMAKAMRASKGVFQWLTDYNDTLENATRLAVYKAGKEQFLSEGLGETEAREKAASIAKNISANFNRKGELGQQIGALYAFFNASAQGTARLGQLLFDMEPGKPKTIRLSRVGKRIVTGGVLLGVAQALALSAAGFSDDDPPEFVRERSIVIPTGGKSYISIPMPLGLHVLPNLGRVTTEWAMGGFDKTPQRAVAMVGLLAEAFVPTGSSGLSMQTLAPTAVDPLVALTENKDWQGRPIAKESMNPAIPGHALVKDTATAWSRVMAEAINYATGGNHYLRGAVSPTPDQLDYLISALGGGVANEISKAQQTGSSLATGESLPTYKIPLVGRLIGNAASQQSEGTAFYSASRKLNELETEIKGLQKDGRSQEAAALRASRPDAYLMAQVNRAERDISKLRKEKSSLIESGAPREQVRAVEEKITARMAAFNRAFDQMQPR